MKTLKSPRGKGINSLLHISLLVLVIASLFFAVSCAQPVYHTVEFYSKGGTPVENQTIEDGKCADEPDDPKKLGSVFRGWYKDDKLTVRYDFDVPVKADIKLYARWFTIRFVTFSFDSKGGSVVETQYLVWGQKAVEPKDPTQEGYLFNGWYTDESYEYLYNFDDNVIEDTELYAKWTKIDPGKIYHTVSFDSQGGTPVEKQLVIDGQKAIEPVSPTKENSAFEGWYTDAACTYKYDFSTAVKSDFTLYAKWLTGLVVTVSFDSKGGSAVEDQKLLSGQKAVEPKDPTLEGYLFKGWYTDEAYEYLYNFDDVVVKDTELYAKWTEIDPSKFYHTVSFDSQGGTPVEKQLVIDGQKVIQPVSPTKDGSTFEGWYTDAACTSKYDFDTAVKSDFTLYAKWTALTYTITYSANGATSGEVPASQTGLAVGQDVILATNAGNLGKTDSIFSGWNTLSDGSGTHYDAGSTVTGGLGVNTTLYAEWKENPLYSITYSANRETSGMAPDPKTGLVPDKDVKIANNTGCLKKDSYVFYGWNTESDGTGTHYDAESTVTGGFNGNTTLYAEWKSGEYKWFGGTIFYVHNDNGAKYTFYDENLLILTDQTVSGLKDAKYCIVEGTKSADKFYVYNKDARVSDKSWGHQASWSYHIIPSNSNYMTDNVYKYGIGDGKTLTEVYCDDGKEYRNTIWEWLANTVNADKTGECDDWFIPCAAELDKLNESGLTNWFIKSIWSSVEYDDEATAWLWKADESEWDIDIKTLGGPYAVAIRAF